MLVGGQIDSQTSVSPLIYFRWVFDGSSKPPLNKRRFVRPPRCSRSEESFSTFLERFGRISSRWPRMTNLTVTCYTDIGADTNLCFLFVAAGSSPVLAACFEAGPHVFEHDQRLSHVKSLLGKPQIFTVPPLKSRHPQVLIHILIWLNLLNL